MIEDKYIIFFVAAGVCVPTGILLASQWQKFHDFIFAFLVFGTCMPGSLFGYPSNIHFMSREWYRGTTRGFEVSYLDLLAIILLVSSIIVRKKEGRKLYWPPSLSLLLVFFIWCALNVTIFSDPKIFGLFELTKLARVILVFLAVTVYIRTTREIHLFVWVLVGTICYEALISLRDRYLYGIHRIQGTLGHPNSLSTYALQFVPLLLAGFFSQDTSKWLKIACFIGYLAGAGCVLLTISRTGFGVLITISFLAFVLFTCFKINGRNLGIAFFGFLLLAAMVFKSYDTMMSRMSGTDIRHEYFTDEGDRGSYFRQSMHSIPENPIVGVGLNNWSWWISKRYGPMAGFDMEAYPSLETEPDEGWQVAPAHNLFLLTFIEVGWPGFLLFLALLIRWLYMNGSAVWSRDETLCTRLRIGIAVSLFGAMLMNWTMWNYKQTENYFLGHVILGVGAVLYSNRPQRRQG